MANSSSSSEGQVGFSGTLKFKVRRTWRSRLKVMKTSLVTTVKAIPKFLHQTV